MSRFGICGSTAAATLATILLANLAQGEAPSQWARLAVSADQQVAEEAIGRLRAMGPDGLEAILAAHRSILNQAVDGTLCGRQDAQWQRVRHAVDQVGGQRDCYTSRLYWYTDLEEAKRAAADCGRPILSLRLLGKLTDEYSCANSRFFRTALYANREVADVLRERFVLHWRSVRPVPRVTIDFGDGRVLERTLTGNSVHYVLDAQGRPVDALPGLYGPQAFLRGLERAEFFAQGLGQVPAELWQRRVRNYHGRQLAALVNAWQGDLSELGVSFEQPATNEAGNGADEPVPARAAALRAVSKSAVEVPILERLAATNVIERSARLDSATDEQAWQALAELHIDDATLDQGSIALMRKQNPRQAAKTAGKQASDPLTPMVRSFQRAVALDTVRNEYLLHREIHQRYIDGLASTDVEELNDWVYAELFLTPGTDPWLGLVPENVYTALENTTAAR